MISIYIGENGSGKSLLLSNLVKEYLERGESVIAIATAINDKFPKRDKKKPYFYMGSRLGKYVAREAIKEAFRAVENTGDKLTSSVFKILEYAGFERQIGFEIKNFNENFEELFDTVKLDNPSELEELSVVLYRLRHYINSNGEGILWVSNYTLFGEGLSGEVLILLLKYEKLLKKWKFIAFLEIYLKKDYDIFPIIDASSGELSLISTTIFIASKINSNTSIFIDEPENSLHPEWQRQYITNLLNLFPYYDIDFHIATHSPLLIAGVTEESNVCVFRFDGVSFKPVDSKIMNIEDALIDQFGIVTPQNNALSERCIDLINDVDDRKITKEKAYAILAEYKDASYEPMQTEFINGVFDIIECLEVGNGKN
ncbi:AAA family ATPase [Shewanella oncorhynchi]|uniref:AAA family ATPase n=1 Tax=Shewanella oncorhynchi TaxID=2726434 RepID=UPI003D79ECEC